MNTQSRFREVVEQIRILIMCNYTILETCCGFALETNEINFIRNQLSKFLDKSICILNLTQEAIVYCKKNITDLNMINFIQVIKDLHQDFIIQINHLEIFLSQTNKKRDNLDDIYKLLKKVFIHYEKTTILFNQKFNSLVLLAPAN